MQYIKKITDDTYAMVDDKLEFRNPSDAIKYCLKLTLGTFCYGMIGIIIMVIIACIADLFS